MIRRPRGLPPTLASLDRTVVMGVLNVTPDSFSDGGRYLDPVAAIAHGRRLIAEGADVVDVGGESSRQRKILSRVVGGATSAMSLQPETLCPLDAPEFTGNIRSIRIGSRGFQLRTPLGIKCRFRFVP